MGDLFYMVMEAGEDGLEPFDGGGTDTAAAADPPPDTGGDIGDAGPPPMDDTGGGDDLGGFSDDGGSDMGGFDDGGGDSSSDDNDDNGNNEKLSEKANNILNQELYKKMVARNKEIEDIVKNLRDLAGAIPIEIVKLNEDNLNHLKSALLKGQDYVIHDFVDAGYGENLLFSKKLEALYTYLLNQIDANLKKVKKS